MTHGDVTGCYIQDHLWNEERVKARGAISLRKIHHFFLEGHYSTYPAGENNTGPVNIYVFLTNAGICNSLIAGYYCSLCKTVKFTRFLPVKIIGRLKTF